MVDKLVSLHIPGSRSVTYRVQQENAHLQGGEGSGNFGHEGRPGEIGGSGGGGSSEKKGGSYVSSETISNQHSAPPPHHKKV